MLPPYDAYLAAVDREVVCPDVDRDGEIWKSAATPGVVLSDGDVVGTWRARKKDRRLEVTVQPWTSWHSSDMEQLEVHSARVSAFHGCAKTTFVVEGDLRTEAAYPGLPHPRENVRHPPAVLSTE